MPQENSNKIIETLADMNEAIGNRFDRVDKQFAEVNGRLDRMDQQLVEIRGRLDRLEQRIGGLEERVAGVEHRLERIENILLEDIQRRVEILEQKADINR